MSVKECQYYVPMQKGKPPWCGCGKRVEEECPGDEGCALAKKMEKKESKEN